MFLDFYYFIWEHFIRLLLADKRARRLLEIFFILGSWLANFLHSRGTCARNQMVLIANIQQPFIYIFVRSGNTLQNKFRSTFMTFEGKNTTRHQKELNHRFNIHFLYCFPQCRLGHLSWYGYSLQIVKQT